jgi:hypothetical protein
LCYGIGRLMPRYEGENDGSTNYRYCDNVPSQWANVLSNERFYIQFLNFSLKRFDRVIKKRLSINLEQSPALHFPSSTRRTIYLYGKSNLGTFLCLLHFLSVVQNHIWEVHIVKGSSFTWKSVVNINNKNVKMV